MYNAKMWLVVKPTVGLPLFFGGVATIALLNHAAVLTHSTFYAEFIKGGAGKGKVSGIEPATDTAKVALTADEATVVMPDGRTGRIVFDPAPRPIETAALPSTAPEPAR